MLSLLNGLLLLLTTDVPFVTYCDCTGCSVQAHIDNCTTARKLFDGLVIGGDKVSVDNIHRQKSNNCSWHHLELHADSDGFYSFSGFTTLLGLNCTEVTSKRYYSKWLDT
jgi:hypothetical protein